MKKRQYRHPPPSLRNYINFSHSGLPCPASNCGDPESSILLYSHSERSEESTPLSSRPKWRDLAELGDFSIPSRTAGLRRRDFSRNDKIISLRNTSHSYNATTHATPAGFYPFVFQKVCHTLPVPWHARVWSHYCDVLSDDCAPDGWDDSTLSQGRMRL